MTGLKEVRNLEAIKREADGLIQTVTIHSELQVKKKLQIMALEN